MKITIGDLRIREACPPGMRLFYNLFGESMEVTRENLQKLPLDDLEWGVAEFLPVEKTRIAVAVKNKTASGVSEEVYKWLLIDEILKHMEARNGLRKTVNRNRLGGYGRDLVSPLRVLADRHSGVGTTAMRTLAGVCLGAAFWVSVGLITYGIFG